MIGSQLTIWIALVKFPFDHFKPNTIKAYVVNIPIYLVSPDSKVHGANMGLMSGGGGGGGGHVGPMNLAIWVFNSLLKGDIQSRADA